MQLWMLTLDVLAVAAVLGALVWRIGRELHRPASLGQPVPPP